MWGVRGVKVHVIHSPLHTTNRRPCLTVVFIIENYLHRGGPEQLKLTLFKSQLCAWLFKAPVPRFSRRLPGSREMPTPCAVHGAARQTSVVISVGSTQGGASLELWVLGWVFFFFFFLATLHSLCDLCSLTRDWNQALSSENTKF